MSDIDSLVKGAPLPGRDASAPSSNTASGDGSIAASTSGKAGDPLSITPSSPSMIYLNLLILEASLRSQYLALRARRRHHTFFLLLLGAWILGFGYALFLAPREDGSGVGGSVYWVVDVLEKVCFMGGVITAALVWATGIWDRGVRWPRRWFNTSNRGLRHINCKVVLLKRSWWAEYLATLAWFLTYGLLSDSGGTSSYRYVEPAVLREVERDMNINGAGGHLHPSISAASASGAAGGALSSLVSDASRDEEKGSRGHQQQRTSFSFHSNSTGSVGHEEDLAPGGDYVKLLLLAKPFSPTFRENWEIYRQEYWDRENERRALIRQKLKQQDRALRRSAGGWFWWLPGRSIPHVKPGGSRHAHAHPTHRPHTPRGGSDIGEKAGHPQHPRHAAVEREHRRTRSNSSRRSSTSAGNVPSNGTGGNSGVAGGSAGGTGTGTSSRSGTPSVEVEDTDSVARKPSTASTAPERRRKKAPVSGARRSSAMDARSVTPENPSPLAKESSYFASDDSKR